MGWIWLAGIALLVLIIVAVLIPADDALPDPFDEDDLP